MARQRHSENFNTFQDPRGESMIWYNYDVSSKKDWKTLINHLQKICRTTLEYDYWQRAAKGKDNENCPICGENYYDKNLKCESHHHPKKLSTIIEEILETHMNNQTLDDKTGLEIIDEIMQLHIMDDVHYINLCEFCHKKFHQQHPDVVDKIHEIFEKRAQEGKEQWDISADANREKIKEVSQNIKYEKEMTEIIKFAEEDQKDDSIEEITNVNLDIISTNDPFKAPDIELESKEYNKPKSIKYETKDGFEEISINIEDLV